MKKKNLNNYSLLFLIISFFIGCSSTNTANQINPTPDPSNPEEIYIPTDLEDAFVELKKMLSLNMLNEMKNSSEDKMVKYQFSLGMWMRNNWRLWGESRLSEYFNEMGVFHPDDMSGVILTSFWRHLNNKPILLNEQIDYYQDFWNYHAIPEDAVSPIDGGPISFIIGKPCKDKTISPHCTIHLGVSKSDKSPWAYQYGKGVFEPNSKDKKEVTDHAQKLGI